MFFFRKKTDRPQRRVRCLAVTDFKHFCSRNKNCSLKILFRQQETAVYPVPFRPPLNIGLALIMECSATGFITSFAWTNHSSPLLNQTASNCSSVSRSPSWLPLSTQTFVMLTVVLAGIWVFVMVSPFAAITLSAV